jgi:pilus assembly protein Flp/PilA
MKDATNRLSVRGFAANEEGATLIEYGLVAALVSVFILGAVSALGDAVIELFDLANQAVPN